MALPASGPISINQVAVEFSRANNMAAFYGAAAGIPTSGTISLNQFYGKSNSVNVTYLIVGGGGGGAYSISANSFAPAGGAGGLLLGAVTLSRGAPFTITVGGGGQLGTEVGQYPTQGGNSSISSVATAIGGGSAGGGSGGSGGGNYYGNNGGTGTPGQGYNGAAGSDNQNHGGGGGAGGTGGTSGVGTASGPGLASSITGASVVYATGGQAGGPQYLGATAPVANTGDGGHGGRAGNGGAGASGVVVITYPSASPAPASITGTYQDISGSTPGFRTYRFTGNGTITF